MARRSAAAHRPDRLVTRPEAARPRAARPQAVPPPAVPPQASRTRARGAARTGLALVALVAVLAACSPSAGQDEASARQADPAPSSAVTPAATAGTAAEPTPSPTPSPTPAPPPDVAEVLAALAPELGPSVPSPTYVPDPAHARDSYPDHYDEKCHQDIDGDTPYRCSYGDKEAGTDVLLVGDSHAAHWLSGLRVAAEDAGWHLEVSSKTACPVIDQLVWIRARDAQYDACLDWGEAVVDRILADPPDLVVTSLSGEYDVVVDGEMVPAGAEADEVLRASMERTWSRLEDAGVRVVVVQDTPWLAQELGDCVGAHPDDPAQCDTPTDEALAASGQENIATAAEATGTPVIDLTPWLCSDEVCPAVVDGTLVMRDEHHVTAEYSRALAPVLEAAVDAVLQQPVG
ncbi:hypothetical protein KIN34_09945 [Cellulomonas sp. DKR-3]|uniref:SGNH domain-containing protein n=1 Tax=Cellulomonas fulva TaxID=2835530 RepID=A0ABS5TZM1_9CELL|nr:SGNH hydrolase domain-containing protein [Cellulomonas fulva]MBT0994608.1 hypothetical protein [Cellulomonas fulva]